jgi:outer membrane lipoprotein-sorting protein
MATRGAARQVFGGTRAVIRVGSALIALLGLGLAPDAAAEDPEAPAKGKSWYAATIARSDTGFLLTHYWAKGPRMRAQTVAGGRFLVTIVDESTYYVLDPSTGSGVGIARSDLAKQGDTLRARPFGDELSALLRAGGERVGEDVRDGVKLERYQLTNDAGRVQIWVVPDRGLPIRVERYVRSSSLRENVDYLNWLENPDIADSFFEPSVHFEIERMTYEEYVKRAMTERVGPAPPFYAHLLHGEQVAPSAVEAP